MRLSTLWKAINEWDPINLLKTEDIDEYKYEINQIYALSINTIDVKKLSGIIYDVFTRSYEASESKIIYEDCFKVAEKIIEIEKNSKIEYRELELIK